MRQPEGDLKRSKFFRVGLLVLIPPAIIGLALAVFISIKVYRVFNPNLDREISGAVTITAEWLEIRPEDPLRPEREIHQVVLDVEKPVTAQTNSWGLVLPDGSVVTPEVQLIDESSNVYSLTEPSFNTNSSTGLTLRGFSLRNLPKDRLYTKVRVRSSKPIRVSRILWRSYNPWDRK